MASDYKFIHGEDVPDTWELPTRATRLSAGYDLRAYVPDADYIDIEPAQTVLIRTGVKVSMPMYAFGMIASRSGLTIREGLIVLNAPGIVDADYNHEVCVILFNTSHVTRRVMPGDRIAQIIFVAGDASFDLVTPSLRLGGFGSTGKD